MSLISDIAPYEVIAEGVPTGIIGLHPNAIGFEDNPHLFTATYHNLLRTLGQADEVRAERYHEWIDACSVHPGVFSRYPDNRERLVSHDEYIGIVNFSTEYAQEICSRPSWYFNNTKSFQGLAPWHYRMSLAVPYYKIHAGQPLTLLDELMWSSAVRRAAWDPVSETSTRCLLALQLRHVYAQGTSLMQQACTQFANSCVYQYGDLGGLYSGYFPKDHPFVTYAKGVRFL